MPASTLRRRTKFVGMLAHASCVLAWTVLLVHAMVHMMLSHQVFMELLYDAPPTLLSCCCMYICLPLLLLTAATGATAPLLPPVHLQGLQPAGQPLLAGPLPPVPRCQLHIHGWSSPAAGGWAGNLWLCHNKCCCNPTCCPETLKACTLSPQYHQIPSQPPPPTGAQHLPLRALVVVPVRPQRQQRPAAQLRQRVGQPGLRGLLWGRQQRHAAQQRHTLPDQQRGSAEARLDARDVHQRSAIHLPAAHGPVPLLPSTKPSNTTAPASLTPIAPSTSKL